MDDKEINHQQSLVQDSFSTIERLESEMASITREFEDLDKDNITNNLDTQVDEIEIKKSSESDELNDVQEGNDQ